MGSCSACSRLMGHSTGSINGLDIYNYFDGDEDAEIGQDFNAYFDTLKQQGHFDFCPCCNGQGGPHNH